MDAGTLGTQIVSSYWYRVAGLAPALRGQLRVHAQRYRSQTWYVVEDRINNRYHRFDRQAWRILRLLDGKLSLERMWQRLAGEAGEQTPSQEDIIGLLGQLHGLDLLAGDTLPDLAELQERSSRQTRQKRISRYLNPLALRIPLLDPDRWLAALSTWLRPVLSRWAVAAWLLWVLPALFLAATHWPELTGNFGERVLALDNLMLLWLIFPLVKALHEIGHGLACRHFGGEVHDMGIMLLIFLPIPYVEASSTWAFPDKRQRMLVGGAGMLVEMAIAAGAFYLWLWVEPGTTKAMAYDVAVLASVTTLLFNGNPLLRYDGYYILADLVEIPNLAQRATRYWGFLVERFVLARREALSPAMASGEAAWFTAYAPLAFCYRIFVMFSIAVFVSTQYFAVGVMIALWSLIMTLGVPLWRGLVWLKSAMAGHQAGHRGRRAAMILVAGLVLLLFAIPMPHHTQVEGVLWLPESGVLRAGETGFVREVARRPDSTVRPGDLILTLSNPTLETGLVAQAARTEAARARFEAQMLGDPVQAGALKAELTREESALAFLRERNTRLELRSAASGRLWLHATDDLPGYFIKHGEVVGYVLPPGVPTVRAVVEQSDQDFIRDRSAGVSLRLSSEPGRTWPARVLRAVPAASRELPSSALGRQGGGDAAIDPRDESGRKSLASHFEYELALPADFPYRLIGNRVSIRFEHPPEVLGERLWRGLRRLFLAYFRT